MNRTVDDEIERMFRVTDQMATAHSILRDRFRWRALTVDVCLLVGSACLTALALLEPSTIQGLIRTDVSVGLLRALVGLFTFTASIVQLKVDWRGRSALHARAVEFLIALKHELGRAMLECENHQRQRRFELARARFELIGALTPPLPDRQFIALKRAHRLKVEVSKIVDQHPGTWGWLARLRITLRDNFGWRRARGPAEESTK